MRTRSLVTVFLLALALMPATTTAAPAWRPRPATFPSMVKLTDVAVEMSDGITVFADVYLPSRDGQRPARGRFPTVMMITPYNKNFGAETREYLVRRGYASVVAEPRGTGSSEGSWDFGSDRERRDGYDLVEWAAAQPWSTGDVGLVGDSYRGFNQWWTAMEQPPHLRAIAPTNAPADMYRTGGASGGELSSLVVAQGLVGVLGLPPGNRAVGDPRAAVRVASGRPAGITSSAAGTADILAGGSQSFDNSFYRARSGYWNVDRIKVPTLIIDGWFDIAQRDAPLMFEELQARGVPVKLVMGPWTHVNYGAGLPAPGMPHTLDELHLRWFDHWVARRQDPGLATLGPVISNAIGEDAYRSSPTWPPRDARPRRLFLTGAAVPGRPGALTTTPGSVDGADVLPWHGASGTCSRSAQQALIGIPPDTMCTQDGRANDLTGLAYDLPAGTRPLRIVGNLAARLFVSTTRNDAFLNVRVESVAPDGTVTTLTDGNDTLSFRALDRSRTTRWRGEIVRPFHPYTRTSVEEIASGTNYEWWIEIAPVAAVIPVGHTLRLTIQPSDAAQAVMVADRGARLVGGATTIHHGAKHPSAIVLPVRR